MVRRAAFKATMMQAKSAVYYCKTAYEDLEFVSLSHVCFSYPKHCHVSSYTIGIVLEGKLSLHINQTETCYDTQNAFVIYPYEMHSLQSSGRYDMIVMSLKTSFVERYTLDEAKGIARHYIDILIASQLLDGASGDRILNELPSLYAYHQHKKSHQPFAIIKDFLETYPEESIDVAHLSRFSAMSKYHFIRKFDESIGMTPHQFQIQNRVRKAKGLLEETVSMTEVGLNAGFYDQSHFIRNFKHLYQISPSSYKAACIHLDELAQSGKKLRK